MLSTDASAGAPRPAATLVLMRPAESGFEVLLTVRPRSLRFMGGATVFPGGAVDAADRDPRWEAASTLDARAAATLLDDDAEGALAWFVCALREAYEEVGFIATVGGDASGLPRANDADAFLQACLDSGVKLAADRLVPGGRWVTPPGAPVRFDARFFLVAVDRDLEVRADPTEVAEVEWLSPSDALEEMSAGRRLMAPPTVEMLQRLERFTSIEDALEGVRTEGVGSGNWILSARLSPEVQIIVAPNPGLMTGPGTNTYVVGHDPAIVIDPAVDDADYIELVARIAGTISTILVTHRHPDHVGGVAALVGMSGAPVRAWGSEPAGGEEVAGLADGEVINVGGTRLRTIYAPGHASDHVCFMLEGTGAMFAGDNVLGEGTAVIAPPDGDMRSYLLTLERLIAEGPARLFTGHFRPLDDGVDVLKGYLEHRHARAQAILEHIGDVPISLEEIVERVYVDVAPQLHPIARYSVLAHLEMAQEDGLVRNVDGRWQAVPDD